MVSEIDINKYNLFSNEFNKQCFYHSNEWINLLSDNYHFPLKIFYYQKENVGVSIIPFLKTYTIKGKKCLNFLPFTDTVEILGENDESVQDLINYIIEFELPNYYKIIFHTNISRYIVNKTLKKKLFIDNSYVKHSLDLTDSFENIYNKFSTNAKRNIKNAIKNQITVKIQSDDQNLIVFYRLHLLTRKKLGTPIQPFSFFKKLKEKILDNDKGMILTVYRDNIPLAAAVFIFDMQSMIYKYGASNPKLLFYRPNELMFYEAIRIAKEKNIKVFDFGISKNNNTGLRHFKKGFGAKETEVSYSIISNNPIIRKGKTGDTKWLRFLIKNSPLWVNKLIGKVFYKYAA